MPLGRLSRDSEWTELDLGADELPTGVPREAWIHVAIARGRTDVAAICRAQPPVATALASAGVPILPLHGQGAFVGPQVPVFDDAVLVRDEARAMALAERLGGTPALLLRGNGAVTVGADVGEAVGRMWVLEASARMNSVAAAAGTPAPLSDDEQAAWRGVAAEILGRIWADLRNPVQA
jgi:HCOMODA/2-hydroxy-3-carboxy-muconic semialdehyde decarboxylase